MHNLRLATYTTAAVSVIYFGLNFVLPASGRSQVEYLMHTLEVQREAGQALICLLNCETGYRGYLVTNNVNFLEPLNECAMHVMSHVEKLDTMVADEPAEKKLMPLIIDAAKKKLAISRKIVAMKNISEDDKIVLMSQGKELMDNYRDLTQELIDEEDRVLEERRGTLTGIRQAILTMRLIFTIILVTLLMWLCAQVSSLRVDPLVESDDSPADTSDEEEKDGIS